MSDVDLLDAYEAKLREVGGGADFSNVHGCIQGLQDTAQGLAYLDHLYARILDELDDAEQAWESVEAEAAREARKDAPSAATATEIKGRITDWIDRHPSAARDRDKVREARRRKEKVERWMRSLEKRGGFAQSAQNGHALLEKAAGGGTR